MKKLISFSVICGLISSYALAATWIDPTYPPGTTLTNCNSLQACIVYGTHVRDWDPICCSTDNSTPIKCTTYKVEEWTCINGPGARYRNYNVSSTVSGYTCHSSPLGCY